MTATEIESTFARRSFGLGDYVFLDDMLYVELSGYRSLSRDNQRFLGIDPANAEQIDAIAPYWRLALEKNIIGDHWLEAGTFGLRSDTFPLGIPVAGTNAATDLGVDSQHQWLGEKQAVTVRGSWIHADPDLRASQALGIAVNSHGVLRSLHVSGSYIFDNIQSLHLRARPVLWSLRLRGWTLSMQYHPDDVYNPTRGDRHAS